MAMDLAIVMVSPKNRILKGKSKRKVSAMETGYAVEICMRDIAMAYGIGARITAKAPAKATGDFKSVAK